MKGMECRAAGSEYAGYLGFEFVEKTDEKKEEEVYVPTIPALSFILKCLGALLGAVSLFYLCQCLFWWVL